MSAPSPAAPPPNSTPLPGTVPVPPDEAKPGSPPPPAQEAKAPDATTGQSDPKPGGDLASVGSAQAKPDSKAVPIEVLPAEKAEEGPLRIIFLVMRALVKKFPSEGESALTISGQSSTITPAGISGGTPPPRRPGFFRRHALFGLAVLLPTFLATIYFGFYASDIYTSESSYVVRSPNKQSAASSGLGALLNGAGFSGFAKAPDDVFAVTQYIRSRDALNFLDERLDLRAAWQSKTIDLFHRFDPLGSDQSNEALYEYYQKRVTVGADGSSGITRLGISGFDPEQVLRINELLLGQAEALVNVLNERGRKDLIRFAEGEVQLAEEKAKGAAQALSDFRNTQAVVDPEKQTMLHFEQIARLQEELIRTRGQLTQLKVFAPDSPHPPALQLRAQTLEVEIAAETEKITGGENSLASKAADYQRLQLEREFADKQLAIAMSALEGARNEAQRQQLYLETIAKPSLPDEATRPKRLRGIFTTFILGLVAWGILSMLLAGVREHQY